MSLIIVDGIVVKSVVYTSPDNDVINATLPVINSVVYIDFTLPLTLD
jgi:hypothetical protein